ncbi:MAG: hypothetical protein II304_03560 [Bacteroidales bacterium]|nr:hypothetical protein [Bacteroidales bacterium]
MSIQNLAAALATTGLSEAEQILILRMRGLTVEEAKAAVETANFAASNGVAATKTGLFTTSLITLKGVTTSLKLAVKSFFDMLASNPLLLIASTVAICVAAFNKLNSVVEENYEKAAEQAQKSKELANNSKEEVESLDTLIEKYKELSKLDKTDSSNREAIAELQSEITDLVGTQAENLDLVNGKLDEQLEKLNLIYAISSGQNIDNLENAYIDARDESSKKIYKDGAWARDFLNSDTNLITFDYWGQDDIRDKANKIINEVWKEKGYGSASTNLYNYDFLGLISDSYSELEFKEGLSIQEKIDALNAAIEAIENTDEFNYVDSEHWKKLVEIRNQFAGTDGVYTKQVNAAQELLEGLTKNKIKTSETQAEDITLLKDYVNYRNKIINEIKSNETISKAIDDDALNTEQIETYVDNYLGTLDEFSDYYNKWYDKYKSDTAIHTKEIKNQFKNNTNAKNGITPFDDVLTKFPKLTDNKSQEIVDTENRINKSKKEIKRFNKWIDGLSNQDKDFVYTISTDFTAENVEKDLEKYSKGGTVDLKVRPTVDNSELQKAGWDVDSDGQATVFSSTYSNADGTVAINFTPIVTDENGNYKETLSPQALQEYAEGVIAGTREDDLKLQIGAEFTGDTAVSDAEAAAQKIHLLQDYFYLKGDPSQFSLKDWKVALDDYKKYVQETGTAVSGAFDDLMAESSESDGEPVFIERVDGYIDSIEKLNDAKEKFNKNELSDADIVDLVKDFPALANRTEDLDVAIDELKDSMNTDMVADFSEQFGKMETDEDIAKLEAFQQTVLAVGGFVSNTNFSLDIEVETENMDKLQNALKESISSTGLTAESIENLTKRYKNLANFNPSQLFERTAQGMQLNAAELRKLEKEYQKTNKEQLEQKLVVLKERYQNLTDSINDSTEATERANFASEQNSLGKQIIETEQLISQYSSLISKYQAWQDAQSNGEAGDTYDTIRDGLEGIQELVDNGLIGTEELRAYTELLSGKDLSNASAEKVKKTFNALNETIKGTSVSVMDFLGEGGTGVNNFLTAMEQLGYYFQDSDGKWNLEIDDKEEVANKLGTSVEFVENILEKMGAYGFEVDIDTNPAEASLDELKGWVGEANDKLKDLEVTNLTFNIDSTDVDDLDAQIKELTNKSGKIKLKPDEKGFAEAQTILAALIRQKQELEENPAVMNVTVDNNTKDDSEKAILYLQELYNEYNDYQVNVKIGADTTGNKKKIKEIKDKIKELPTSVKTALKLDTSKLNLKNIKKKLNNITPEMIVKAGVNEEKVKDYKPENKTAEVTYTVDDTAVTTFKNKNHNKTATLTYKVKTEGKAKVDGTAHLFGTAYSKGNWSIKENGIALGGEVGQELVVRNGRFFTIGNDSAEFFQYKKGDIIFNAAQTEQIFKNGRITSGNKRGKAFAEGTAFEPGSASAIGSNKYVPVGNASEKNKSSNSSNSSNNSNNNKSNTNNDKGKTTLKKFQDWVSKFVDWIEIRISRLQNKIDIAISKAEHYVENGNFDKSAKQYRKAINETQKLIDANTSGAKKYNNQANKILNKAVNDGLISSKAAKGIKAKVKNGTIDISSYGEKTQAVIKEYQSFYENSLDCSKALVDLNANLREYYSSLYNLPIEEATRKIDNLSNSLKTLEAKADAVSGGGRIYNREVVRDARTNKSIADKNAVSAKNKVTSKSQTLLNSLKGKEKKAAKKKIKAGKKVSTKKLSGKALKNAIAYNDAIEAKRVANIEKKDANAEYNKALKQQNKYANSPDYQQVNDLLDNETQNSKNQNKENQKALRKTSKNLTKAERRKETADKAVKKAKKGTDAYKKAIKEQKAASKALSAARKANKTATDNAKKSEAEYTKTLQDNTKAKLDNIASSFDSTRSITSAKINKLEAKNDLNETLGINLKQSDYNSLISNAKTDVTDAEKALDAYQKAYDKNKKNLSEEDKKAAQEQLQQLKQEVYEAQKVQAELENTQIQIPFDNLEEGIELLDTLKNKLSALISLKNALGEDEGSQVYFDMIASTQEQADKAKFEYDLAIKNKALAEANKDGVYGGKSVDDWQKEADEYLAEEYKYLEEVKTIKNDLSEYYIEPFEKAINSMDRFIDILKGMSELMDEDMLLDSDGHFTEYGITQIATFVQQYETARDKIQKYEEELAQVNQNYNDGLYTLDEYNEKTAELQKNILSGASDMKSAMDSVIKMYKDMSKAELDNLFELIDARNDALKAKKDYYDYDKTLRSKTKDVQSLQSQLAALDGITTAEAKARRAQLLSDLSEAQDELDETVQNHLLEISQDSLDDMKDVLQEGFDEMWDKVSKDLDGKMKVFSVGQSLATDSVNSVNETLKYLLSYYGVDDGNSSGLVEAHYAKGTKSVPRTLKALVAEKGKGEIITSQDGMIMTLHQGDGVVPNDLAERIYDMATNGYAPSLVINEIKLPNMPNDNHNVGVTQYYDSLINIEGSADAATVEDLKKLSKDILEKSYGYTTKRLYKDYIHSGGKRKV